jgi:hypothetical protein
VPGNFASAALDDGVIELARVVGPNAARDAVNAWQAGYNAMRLPVEEAALWTRLPEIADQAVELFAAARRDVFEGDTGRTVAALVAEGADPLVTQSIAIRVDQAAKRAEADC